jgi:2-polyprenyl-3-methyl-5-hydroxy-6-metoxy-1,4-benzoquinol methylase
MPLFPLDAVRNAVPDRDLEPVLEDVREDVVAFPFEEARDSGDVDAVLEAYDLARPRLNLLAALLRDASCRRGADISTGIGFLPVVLTRLGLTVTATERDLGLSRFAVEHGIDVLPYDIGRSAPPFQTGSLDFVIFAEVLEHVKLSPVPLLAQLASLLRPGGCFLLSTPNIARLAHVELLAAGENFLEPFPEDLPPGTDATDFVEHVREYSVREIVEAVEGAGLGVERVLMTGWGEAGYRPLANPYSNEIIVVEARA